MDENRQKLRKRLENIWQPPDFGVFFKKYAKRPAHTVQKDTILFNAGDPLERLYYIENGFVKLYQLSEEGRETIIYLYGKGYVLGVRALTSQDKRAKHHAEAITDATIITLSHAEYFEAIIECPQYLIDLTHVFIDRLNYTERKLEGFITTDATARIANFLSDCVRRFKKPMSEEIINHEITLPLEFTHQQIAEFVGAFRETVTLALHRLEKAGVLRVERGKLTILDIAKLNIYTSHPK